MPLLTKEIRAQLPKLYATQDESDPLFWVKFFTPWTGWTWYAAEFDGHDLFFGFVDGLEKEFGYFRLSELESVRGPGDLRIERDQWFRPCRWSELEG
jgi:hypothetical protein